MNSQFLSLNLKDISKGSIVFVGTAILTALLTIIQQGRIPNVTEISGIVVTSISAGAAYFLKNLFTNSDGDIGKAEPEVKPDTLS